MVNIYVPSFEHLKKQKSMWALLFIERNWRKVEKVVEVRTFTLHRERSILRLPLRYRYLSIIFCLNNSREDTGTILFLSPKIWMD
jgi:hypothetical protein